MASVTSHAGKGQMIMVLELRGRLAFPGLPYGFWPHHGNHHSKCGVVVYNRGVEEQEKNEKQTKKLNQHSSIKERKNKHRRQPESLTKGRPEEYRA